jgi:hypothetical protein
MGAGFKILYHTTQGSVAYPYSVYGADTPDRIFSQLVTAAGGWGWG